MKKLAPFAVLVLSVPAVAQVPCGIPEVTVTVSPPIAAPGQPIDVTITNGSDHEIVLPSSCVYIGVYSDAACTAPVAGVICLWVLVPLAPGESHSQQWGQTDDNGVQVPDGSYTFDVWYFDGGNLVMCCAQGVTITSSCAAASATPRNGAGTNPVTLTSVNPPALGESWDTSLDCAGHAPANASLAVHALAVNGPQTPFGQVLVGGTRHFRIVQPHAGAAVAFSQPVPPDVALCGLTVSAQGLCGGAPGPQLGNALDLVLGL